MPFNVDELRNQLRNQIRRFADDAADDMVEELQRAAPHLSGELRDSITHDTPQVSDSRVVIRVRTGDLIQADTTEKGARPHTIKPRRPGGALAFYWPKVGRTVILKQVHHPGNPARPWFAPTVDKWQTIAQRVWNRVSR